MSAMVDGDFGGDFGDGCDVGGVGDAPAEMEPPIDAGDLTGVTDAETSDAGAGRGESEGDWLDEGGAAWADVPDEADGAAAGMDEPAGDLLDEAGDEAGGAEADWPAAAETPEGDRLDEAAEAEAQAQAEAEAAEAEAAAQAEAEAAEAQAAAEQAAAEEAEAAAQAEAEAQAAAEKQAAEEAEAAEAEAAAQAAAEAQAVAEKKAAEEQLAQGEETFLRFGELEPNTAYERNGYTYETDEQGRVIEVHGPLHLGESHRTGHQTEVGHLGVAGDEGGPLVGARFGGSPEGVNLVPQDMHLNRSDWKAMENEWADALGAGQEVVFDTSLGYDGNDKRPSDFIVTYTIDGVPHTRHFPNERGAEPEDLV